MNLAVCFKGYPDLHSLIYHYIAHMKKKYPLLILFCYLVSEVTFAQPVVPSAADILQNAYKQANLENKNVFVIFHASWCVWCHKMDSSMNDKACKELFTNNYVTCHLTVDESKDKKNLENPGAVELRKKYHGEDAGLPFWLIFDRKGKLLADSRIRPEGAGFDTTGESIGCPASKEEVTYFIKLLRSTSRITIPQSKLIEERFSRNK